MYLTLYFLVLVPFLYRRIGFDVKIVVKTVCKIVLIVTVSFLNFFLPFNIVSHWYLDSLYACSGIHMMRVQ